MGGVPNVRLPARERRRSDDMTNAMRGWVAAILLGAAASPWAARAEGGGAMPLADDPTLIALAVALSCADAPEGVEAALQGPSGPAAAGPEIELVATVRAKALRFDEVPKVDVVFRGTGKRRTVWKTERVNLPMRPQPGVTYRDVQVRLTISSDVEELTSMLRQARLAARGIRVEEDAGPAPAAPVQPPTLVDPPAVKAAEQPAAAAAAPAPPAPDDPAAAASPPAASVTR